jgi:hypothetical protein
MAGRANVRPAQSDPGIGGRVSRARGRESSRVRGRAYHPSDVVAGGILGCAIGRGVDWIWSVLVDAIMFRRHTSPEATTTCTPVAVNQLSWR